jgi:hypothetical protein
MSLNIKKLLSELEKETSEERQARIEAKQEEMVKLEKMFDEDEMELVAELNEAGFLVKSVWDFVNSSNYYLEALPILMKHLKIKHHPRILDGIARSLAVKEFKPNDELWDILVDLYLISPCDSDIDVPEERGAQMGIAAALRQLSTKARVESLKMIIETRPEGDAVDWLEAKVKAYTKVRKPVNQK